MNIPLADDRYRGRHASATCSSRRYELTAFQSQLLRSAVALLRAGATNWALRPAWSASTAISPRWPGCCCAPRSPKPAPELAQVERCGIRTDAIIYEQAADPNLTPATIAAQLNISLRQLYRAFNGTESPAARIRRRRLERAAEILAARSGPGHVERVALECGFASAEYFSRAFRREFGLSPRAYRSAHRELPAAH